MHYCFNARHYNGKQSLTRQKQPTLKAKRLLRRLSAFRLRYGYRVDEFFLTALKLMVKNKKKLGAVVQNPEQIITELDRETSDFKSTDTPVAEKPRKPGQFQSEWKDRVFVGGSYSTHVAEIYHIGEICKAKGYDPVIADRFETSPNRVHHHALMLLQKRVALFRAAGIYLQNNAYTVTS